MDEDGACRFWIATQPNIHRQTKENSKRVEAIKRLKERWEQQDLRLGKMPV